MNKISKVFRRLNRLVIKKLQLAQHLHRRRGYKQVSILNYHGVHHKKLPFNDFCFITTDAFEQQIRYLDEHFNVVSFEDAEELVSKENDKPIAIITFDDGFYNNCSEALPVLQKYKMPATVFLATQHINRDSTLWFCELLQLLTITKKNCLLWQGQSYPLRSSAQKSFASSELQAQLNTLKNKDISAALKGISKTLECYEPLKFDKQSPFRMLDSAAIEQMIASKLITFGAHTHSHSILSNVEEDVAKSEIAKSISKVEKLTGHKCATFAYPNGRKQDFNVIHQQFLNEHNIKLAVSTEHGLASFDTDKLSLKRLFISSTTALDDFKLHVHGCS